MTRLVLASASPRRRELLGTVGLDLTGVPSDVDESLVAKVDDPAAAAQSLALEKARAVAESRPDDVVIGADTMVVHHGVVLGKPADGGEARKMLESLRDRQHQVITGVAVVHGRRFEVAHAVTSVRMRAYTNQEVTAYIARGESFDKAGGYAIQDPEFWPAAAWQGCYCNVVGLPLALTLELIARLDPDLVPARPEFPSQCDRCPHRLKASHAPL